MRGKKPDIEFSAEAVAACACNNLRKASRAVTQHFDQTLAPSGLRSTQLVVLLEIHVAGHSTVPQLARRLVMDRSTLQRNVQPLIERGFVSVESNGRGRSRAMSLTPSGRRAIETAAPLWRRAQASFVEHLGQDRWHVLRESLSVAVTAARGDPSVQH